MGSTVLPARLDPADLPVRLVRRGLPAQQDFPVPMVRKALLVQPDPLGPRALLGPRAHKALLALQELPEQKGIRELQGPTAWPAGT